MLQPEQLDEILCRVATMDRATIARSFRDIKARFPIDFSAQFIEVTDLDRLRHIFLAACLQAQHFPNYCGDIDQVSLEHVA